MFIGSLRNFLFVFFMIDSFCIDMGLFVVICIFLFFLILVDLIVCVFLGSEIILIVLVFKLNCVLVCCGWVGIWI